jgi:hypothetical protein
MDGIVLLLQLDRSGALKGMVSWGHQRYSIGRRIYFFDPSGICRIVTVIEGDCNRSRGRIHTENGGASRAGTVKLANFISPIMKPQVIVNALVADSMAVRRALSAAASAST